MFLGIDIGSVSVKAVLLGKKIEFKSYQRHQGKPLPTLIALLKNLPLETVKAVVFTGSGGKIPAGLYQLPHISEMKALNLASRLLYPEVQTLVEIGGQDSKLLILKHGVLADFAMNSLCAAGTGSFLDQQASRLGIAIEDFGELALRSKNPPRIAGRCSVFAKSDMIHLQQKATPVEDILAGLCLAMARNFKSTVGKGKGFGRPIAFVGGVAFNQGMIHAFENVLELKPGELVIPEGFNIACAAGAAVHAGEIKTTGTLDIKVLEDHLKREIELEDGLEPLVFFDRRKPYHTEKSAVQGEKVRAYLGVDIGSISTNVVVLDENNNLLSKRYLMTAGRPIEAVCQGLREVGEEVGDRVEIAGACTTGSGRYLIGDFIGADVVKNEITAQARAAIEIDKEVDTIFEIGGQDSKYISLSNGAIVDFEMNKACAAGTGSYLEEQAEKLGINIKGEFGELSLSSSAPARLGERCTVFMESDVVQSLQRGVPTKDIAAGLAYSIVQNYLNRVVQGKKVGNRIFFQGGVAFNQAVVAAFEKVTGKEVSVPEHHEVTGAIGCCLLAKEHIRQNNLSKSKFKGFDISKLKYEVKSFECQGCANHCEVNRVSLEGNRTLFYGHRCEKYEVEKKQSKGDTLPDLFAEREKMLFDSYDKRTTDNETGIVTDKRKRTIGIPRALFFYWDYFPFFNAFFSELGCEVVLSDKTNKEIVEQGLEAVLAEPCFPIKATHGHVRNLIDKKVDHIFLPYIMNLPRPDFPTEETHTCPYVLAMPDMIKTALECSDKLISPTIFFRRGEKHVRKILAGIGRTLGAGAGKTRRAIQAAEAAQDKFNRTLSDRGKEVLENLDGKTDAVVIIGRSYNSCDQAINLEIPKLLREQGVLAIPMDFLPLSKTDISSEWPGIYWRTGQKIMSAAEIVSADPRLSAVYITNFGCGPDSFINHFFREKMGERPYLSVEIDEHSADTGVITRIEAFLDSLQNTKGRKYLSNKIAANFRNPTGSLENRVLYLPNMCDHTKALAAAFTANGIRAEVLPESDAETLRWGRKYTSGKECFPAQITIGDIIKLIRKKDFDPGRSAFFMPTVGGGCRFSYYHKLLRLVLDELGHRDIPIYAPSQSTSFHSDFKGLGIGFLLDAWKGIIAVDLLEKALYEKRPLEKVKGAADNVYQKYLNEVSETVRIKKDLLPVLIRAAEEFKSIAVSANGDRPVIGIVGEIFVRSHRFSNENVIRQVEELGGIARPSSMGEWLMYTNFIRYRETLENKQYFDYFMNWITTTAQLFEMKKIEKPFRFLKTIHEASFREVEEAAAPYINLVFRGEVVLGFGKAKELQKKGAAGMINVMPFTCMPGNVATSLIKRYREENQGIPFISIAYDGLNEANNRARLEAFMDQCRQYKISLSSSL